MENSGAGDIAVNNKTEGSVENVKEFLDKNDILGAKDFLKPFLETEPINFQAAFIMAQIFEMENEYTQAADLYEKVFPTEIPNEFYGRVMHIYELADRYDKVYTILKSQLKTHKDDMDFIERYANTCCILHKTEEAIEQYNTILSKQPDNIVALKQLIDIYENTNPMMFRLTRARLYQLEENIEGAERDYKKAFALAEKDEDILQIRYQLAKLYRSEGKNELALDEYIFLTSANEGNFSVYIELAEIYIEMNNQSSAINALKRALDLYPDSTETMQMLADTYADIEEYAKAENYYERLLEKNQNNVEVMVNLAKVYLHLDKLDKTRDILQKAENTDANSTEVLTAMAGYYTYIDDYDKAKTYCNRIIQKLPKSPLGYRKLAQLYSAKGENHLASFNFGIYHELRNEIDDAINEYSTALQYKKDDFETIKRLANLHETLGELEIAADYFHTLFEAKIDIIENTKKLANIYIKLKDYEYAQRYIDTAMKENPDIELLFLTAKCSYKLKDFETALEQLEEYKEKTKSLENIEEVNKLIEEIQNKKENGYNPFAKIFKFLDKI